MVRSYTKRHGRAPPIGEDILRILHDEAPTKLLMQFALDNGKLRELWAAYGDQVVEAWAYSTDKSGKRPSTWWQFSAPSEPRRLLSGKGCPVGDAYEFGIPNEWCGYDPADPPTFESQYTYLARHNLLLPNERPSDDQPVVVKYPIA